MSREAKEAAVDILILVLLSVLSAGLGVALFLVLVQLWYFAW